jgi:hypothetical protein
MQQAVIQPVCTVSSHQPGTFLANAEEGLCHGQQRERLLCDEQHAIAADLGEDDQVGEKQRPERARCSPFNDTQVPAKYPLAAGRAQDERLQNTTSGLVIRQGESLHVTQRGAWQH